MLNTKILPVVLMSLGEHCLRDRQEEPGDQGQANR